MGHLIRDRDAKFSGSFDNVWRSIDTRVVCSPIRAPNANAHAQRWVGTARRVCRDHLLIVGSRHLGRVLSTFVDHYNAHRLHQAVALVPRPRPARIAQRDSTRSSIGTCSADLSTNPTGLPDVIDF